MKSTQKRLVIAGLVCALGFTGCGSKKAESTTTASVEMATVNAASNLVGSGVSSCDSSLTSATYDPSGKGSVTSVDGQPVSAAAASADTSGSSDASADSSSVSSASASSSSSDSSSASGTDTSADGTDTLEEGTSADGTDSTGADTSADGTDTAGTDTSANGTGSTGADTSADSTASSSGNASSGVDFSVTADSENQKAALCLASLDKITWSSGVTSFGGYIPSRAMLKALQDTASSIDSDGKNYGYMLIDINTYAGVCYDSDAHFYSSGAAAAAYIIGTLNSDSTALSNSGEEFQIVAANGSSSRDTYTTLMNSYGFSGMNAWMEAGGVNTAVDGYGAAFLSAEDLSRIWLKNYQYFTTDASGSAVETWFQSPADSPIRTALGSRYTTWNLPGSYSGESSADYDTTVDAGIVSSGSAPYIIAIVSDYAAQPDKLVPLVQALDAVHTELMSAAGLS